MQACAENLGVIEASSASASREESSLVPDIAAEFVKFAGGFRDSPDWASAYVLVPWNCYQ